MDSDEVRQLGNVFSRETGETALVPSDDRIKVAVPPSNRSWIVEASWSPGLRFADLPIALAERGARSPRKSLRSGLGSTPCRLLMLSVRVVLDLIESLDDYVSGW